MDAGVGKLTQKVVDVNLLLRGVTMAGEPLPADKVEIKSYKGLAVSAQISKAGLPAMNRAVVDIFNIKQEDVHRISTTTPYKLDVRKNLMEIKAGIAGEPLSMVFRGEINLAYGTFNGPDTGIHIEALSGIFPTTEPAKPFTHNGQISGLSIIQKYAKEMGYCYRDPKGVQDKMLTDPVINGSPMEKVRHVAKHMDIQLLADDECIIVLPWDSGIEPMVRVSPDTGMIGYPFFSPNGISFTHEWRPQFRQGGLVEIERSRVAHAKGIWKIVKLEHTLQCFGAGPGWDSYMEAYKVDG